MQTEEASPRLAPLAYRLATDRDFFNKLKESFPELPLEELKRLSSVELAALRDLLDQGFSTGALASNAQSPPLDGRWWSA